VRLPLLRCRFAPPDRAPASRRESNPRFFKAENVLADVLAQDEISLRDALFIKCLRSMFDSAPGTIPDPVRFSSFRTQRLPVQSCAAFNRARDESPFPLSPSPGQSGPQVAVTHGILSAKIGKEAPAIVKPILPTRTDKRPLQNRTPSELFLRLYLPATMSDKILHSHKTCGKSVFVLQVFRSHAK